MTAEKRKSLLSAFRLDEAHKAVREAADASLVDTGNSTGKATGKATGTPVDKPKNRETNRETNRYGDLSEYQDTSPDIYRDDYRDKNTRDLSIDELQRHPHIRTENALRVWDYLSRKKVITTTIPQLSRHVGVKFETVRKILQKWEEVGLITKERFVEGSFRGITLEVIKEVNYRDTCRDDYRAGDPDDYPVKNSSIDRQTEKENLSVYERLMRLTEEDLAIDYPGLVGLGFGVSQIRQIAGRLRDKAKLRESIFDALRWADWEADHGGIIGRNGQPATHPLNYVFSSLASEGSYRKPPGYKSGAELMLEQLREERMRDAEAKQKLEEEAFLAWDESLSEEEKGRIEKLAGGPETTLPPIRVQKRRKYWEEKVRGEAQGADR